MPELPEVETVVRALNKALEQQRIKSVQIFQPKLRFPVPQNFSENLSGQTILSVTRRAKYGLIHLDNHYNAILHLGMSGRIRFIESSIYEKQKHDHIVLHLENGQGVAYNDARRFGFWDLIHQSDIANATYFKKLGPEPFDEKLTADLFYASLVKRQRPIKVAILDQCLIAGVGNIYASEALYIAGITPSRPANSLTLQETAKLLEAIRLILMQAIEAGGSTLRDHRQLSGETGYFQFNFKVYGKEGKNCAACNHTIVRTTQVGRSTFFCKTCQR